MKVTKKSVLTGKTNSMELDVDAFDLIAMQNGGLVQDVCPHLTIIEREFLISGMSEAEQDKLFGAAQ